ncbi:PilN domain-containing protein [Aeromonas cavernicola]|uniref:MSHA biogenesis protein MshI n=1 Tax=Aeromonas cavernicola TaxID=1006623 RepID=A0A2H9U2H2_9GAMM|nr:PilN domain-containing protein [Aeromonas cavernicola]PJG58169.1 MSHA biogenesis protein MshI [Aeromonas cavernicola]
MKRQLNLYSAEYRPKRQWASLNQMVLAWSVALLGVLLVGGGYEWQQRRVSQALAQTQIELERQQGDAQRLDSALAQHQADPLLQQQLAALEEDVAAKNELLRQLSSLSLQKDQGYAELMADLARIRSPHLSLQRIEINQGHINLSGLADSSEDVPAWVNRFKQTPSLAGKQFGELTLMRDKEGQLVFQLGAVAREKS